jgi:magnesium-transporting ATPase (P-type)
MEDLTRQIGLWELFFLLLFLPFLFFERRLFPGIFIGDIIGGGCGAEGLPAVMTITLAIGIKKLAEKKAIIRSWRRLKL